MSDTKPWQQSPKPPRRTAPEPLARDRPVEARQPRESLGAYKAFLAYLEHGSIRKAADALTKNRTVLERWSKRWCWPERKSRILARHARGWTDQLEYEEKHHLPAANVGEFDDREWAAFTAVTFPKTDRELKGMLKEFEETMKGYGLP